MKAPSSRASSSHAFLLQHKRLLLRLGVLLCLAATAAIVGFESYAQLRDLQRQEERRQFSALSDKVQRYTEKSLSGSEQALSTIAETALQFCPDRSSWPQCAVPFAFFQRALTPLQNITDARSFALAVCVSPAQVADFEAFAYAFFEASGHPELGESPFGRGVYSLDPATQTRFHDVSGTTGDGERVMLLPNLQVTDVESVNADAVMYNVYSTAERVRNVDFSMDCIERENRSVADCTALSGFITTAQDSPGVRPSTYFSLPIVVREGDAQVVVGFARDLHSWDTTLSCAERETDRDCVFVRVVSVHVKLNILMNSMSIFPSLVAMRQSKAKRITQRGNPTHCLLASTATRRHRPPPHALTTTLTDR